MSNYKNNYHAQSYLKRPYMNKDEQKYQKYTERRRTNNDNENTSKKRDNSAILKRAINKRYKEDINKNLLKSSDYYTLDRYDEKKYYDNNQYNNNFDYNNYRDNNLYNSYYISQSKPNYQINSYSNYYSNENPEYIDNNHYEEALISRINKNRNKKMVNIKNSYSTTINDKNIYDEFIINFNSRLNRENYPRNALNRNNLQYMKKYNNNIYNNIQ